MGGATPSVLSDCPWCVGLSPRGRGNPIPVLLDLLPLRSIPAWAGQPFLAALARSWKAVYPRVGGATTYRPTYPLRVRGLSPRGRGNRETAFAKRGWTGSIPAWAGQPCCQSRPNLPGRVYPRVGGATAGWPSLRRWIRVYPRVGGATQQPAGFPESHKGLSPRGRGNHCQQSR